MIFIQAAPVQRFAWRCLSRQPPTPLGGCFAFSVILMPRLLESYAGARLGPALRPLPVATSAFRSTDAQTPKGSDGAADAP